jgi:hypothetical protein
MKKVYRKIFIIAPIVIICLILASPWISLILSEKYRDHTYYFLTYKIIADKETQGLTDNKDITIALFNYVRKSIFTPAGLTPYDAKPIIYLINGTGYCDYVAQVYTILLAQKDIPARYAFLMDKDGISPHAMAEVYLDGKWRIIDASCGLIFLRNTGFATLDELSNNPGLILNHNKLLAIKNRDINEFNSITEWYNRMFPVPSQPQRSSPKTKRITLFDRITTFYWLVFKDNFARNYQDLYLKLKTASMKDPREKLFLLRAIITSLAGQMKQ